MPPSRDHLVTEASKLNHLPRVQKYTLMGLAHDVKDKTRIVAPGIEKLCVWVGANERAVYSAISALITEGLVERVRTGRPHQRARFRVFPKGCCPQHNDDLYLHGGAGIEAPNDCIPAQASKRSKPASTPQALDPDMPASACTRSLFVATNSGRSALRHSTRPCAGSSTSGRRKPRSVNRESGPSGALSPASGFLTGRGQHLDCLLNLLPSSQRISVRREVSPTARPNPKTAGASNSTKEAQR